MHPKLWTFTTFKHNKFYSQSIRTKNIRTHSLYRFWVMLLYITFITYASPLTFTAKSQRPYTYFSINIMKSHHYFLAWH